MPSVPDTAKPSSPPISSPTKRPGAEAWCCHSFRRAFNPSSRSSSLLSPPCFLVRLPKAIGLTVRVVETVSYVLVILIGLRLLFVKGRGFLIACRELISRPSGEATASSSGEANTFIVTITVTTQRRRVANTAMTVETRTRSRPSWSRLSLSRPWRSRPSRFRLGARAWTGTGRTGRRWRLAPRPVTVIAVDYVPVRRAIHRSHLRAGPGSVLDGHGRNADHGIGDGHHRRRDCDRRGQRADGCKPHRQGAVGFGMLLMRAIEVGAAG